MFALKIDKFVQKQSQWKFLPENTTASCTLLLPCPTQPWNIDLSTPTCNGCYEPHWARAPWRAGHVHPLSSGVGNSRRQPSARNARRLLSDRATDDEGQGEEWICCMCIVKELEEGNWNSVGETVPPWLTPVYVHTILSKMDTDTNRHTRTLARAHTQTYLSPRPLPFRQTTCRGVGGGSKDKCQANIIHFEKIKESSEQNSRLLPSFHNPVPGLLTLH